MGYNGCLAAILIFWTAAPTTNAVYLLMESRI